MSEKTLIIVESPTKAKTITKFLAKEGNYTVLACNGHVRTLPKEDLCIDIKNDYKPKYIIDPNKKDIIEKIKQGVKEASRVILATDEDREGESISWHLVQVLELKEGSYSRMVFHEITKTAIQNALATGRKIDMNMVEAQESRRVLDRLYGYCISPLLWSKLSNKNLSAGRVQSPGLRLVVDCERQRMKFGKQPYYSVNALINGVFRATLTIADGMKIANAENFNRETGMFKNEKNVRILDKAGAEELARVAGNESFKIDSYGEKTFSEEPKPPFITSTLQQEGIRKLKIGSSEVMKIAQSLYEKGFITYMRTDSTFLSQEGLAGARNAAGGIYGAENVSSKPRIYDKKTENSQEAHEAIRPAGEVFVKPEESGLTGKELSLYSLIFKRTLASQMKNAEKRTGAVTVASMQRPMVFKSSVTVVDYPGFLAAYSEGKDEEDEVLVKSLPDFAKGKAVSLSEITSQKHETAPVKRYTEASLISELEKKGIGRPSTYASIIGNMFDKKYVVKQGNALVPTFTAFGVIGLLESYFSTFVDYEFTNGMEESLNKIAEGKINKLDYLKSFYEGSDGLKKKIEDNRTTINSKAVKQLVFPQVSKPVYVGPYGAYIKDEDGKIVSLPPELLPYELTDEKTDVLLNHKEEKHVNKPEILGTSPSGEAVLYCTGKYGDYWQLGDAATSKDVKRFKVPKELLNMQVPLSRILEFFALPRNIGQSESGEEIIAAMGKFGPFLKCGNDYRNLKTTGELFSVTLEEARNYFKEEKTARKKASFKTKSNTEGKSSKVVKDFGLYENENLAVVSGRYGFYLKHGNVNYPIDRALQKDEEKCKSLTLEEAVAYLKKQD